MQNEFSLSNRGKESLLNEEFFWNLKYFVENKMQIGTK